MGSSDTKLLTALEGSWSNKVKEREGYLTIRYQSPTLQYININTCMYSFDINYPYIQAATALIKYLVSAL
jgi:hypothetical protein